MKVNHLAENNKSQNVIETLKGFEIEQLMHLLRERQEQSKFKIIQTKKLLKEKRGKKDTRSPKTKNF